MMHFVPRSAVCGGVISLCLLVWGAGDFDSWVQNSIRPLASQHGITSETLYRVLGGVPQSRGSGIILEKRIAAQRVPPSLNRSRNGGGRVAAVNDKTRGVPRSILLAIWKKSSRVKRHVRQVDFVRFLAKKAFEHQGHPTLINELMTALKALQDSGFSLENSLHLWDADTEDSMGSGAEHEMSLAQIERDLLRDGWREGEPWGVEVVLPASFSKLRRGLSFVQQKKYWKDLGVKSLSGALLPEFSGSLLVLEGSGRVFLVYTNFKIILKWLGSVTRTLKVCQLSDQIGL